MDIIAATKSVLNELDSFLSQIDDHRYAQELDILLGSSTGMHTRHLLEFYQCLIDQSTDGCVNYDHRKRNNRIENQSAYASETIRLIKDQIEKLDLDKPILLESGFNPDLNEYEQISSNLRRELVYNIEHAIHHMAIIRIGISQIAPEIKLSDNFGIAPSTVKYQKSIKTG